MQTSPKAILFDLDGTLVDTAPDLAAALNYVLQKNNKKPLAYEVIRPIASDGSLGLLRLGFGINEKSEEFPALREQLLNYYQTHIADHSRLFEGMENVLDYLAQQNIAWGVVTNKPYQLSCELLAKLNLAQKTLCIIGGDSLPQRKPHPAPLLQAAKILNVSPEQCWYIGDARRDIDAGKNANMTTLVALWGYLHKEENPKSWQADFYIEKPLDLLQKI